MAYSKPKPNELAEMSDAIAKMDSLSEGESFILTGSPATIELWRQKIYSYLHYENIKSFFKVMRRTPEKLEVLRKSGFRATIIDGPTAPQRVEDFVKECMITISDENEALECIREAVACSNLDQNEGFECLELWRRKIAPTT